MSYYVRLLTPSVGLVSFSQILLDVESVKLIAGKEDSWEQLEIDNPQGESVSIVERCPVSPVSPAEIKLSELRWALSKSEPFRAQEWIKNYLDRVKTVYSFQLLPDRIHSDSWPVLGRVQNLLKDALTGIIQADNEGYYNETGDYILWQMYSGATGTIPAALLDENGEWARFELRLNDAKAIEQFKAGLVPRKGSFGQFLRR